MFGVKSDKYWYCFHSIPIKIDARDEMKIWETAIGWHCMKLLYGDTDYYVCNSRKFTNNSKHNYILRDNCRDYIKVGTTLIHLSPCSANWLIFQE